MINNLMAIKEKMKELYGKYDRYIVPVFRFLFALITFVIINSNIGYMAKLKNPLVVIMLSAICAFLPNGALIVLSAIVILAHLSAMSLELTAMIFIVFLVLLCAYFSFAPKGAYMVVLTAVLFAIKLPYLAPFIAGLTMGVFAFIPVSIGIFAHYLIKFAASYDNKIEEMTMANITESVKYILDGLFTNKEMMLFVLAFAICTLVIYIIRKLSIDYAWFYASVIGAILNLVLMILGKFVFDANVSILGIIFGNILGFALAFALYVMVFSGDYVRTEYVQFEDDDYYYFVKAVPKVSVTSKNLKVKKINAHKTTRNSTQSDVAEKEYDADYSNDESDEGDDFIQF